MFQFGTTADAGRTAAAIFDFVNFFTSESSKESPQHVGQPDRDEGNSDGQISLVTVVAGTQICFRCRGRGARRPLPGNGDATVANGW
jgi:hypothetical protein